MAEPEPIAPEGPTPVVLLHGLRRSRLAMLPMARALRRAGYRPLNQGYFAGRRPLRDIAARVGDRLDRLLRHVPDDRPVHFVTHSLGGILTRLYLATGARPGTRVVQLAPPNQGASLAERISGWPVVGALAGGPLRDLWPRSDRLDIPRLPDAVEVGVIAGGKGAASGYGFWFDDDSDGIVRVAETYLPEARDWILLPHVHTFIMNGRDTRANAVAFLEGGRFCEDAPRLELDALGHVRVRWPEQAP